MKYKLITLTFLSLFTLNACEKGWHADAPFKPMIEPEVMVKKASIDRSSSLFSAMDDVSPQDFIENLKRADIIRSAYYPKTGLPWEQKIANDVVIELGTNFYTLPYADKVVVADLLSRAYDQDYYVLHDATTQKPVGFIKGSELHLY